MNRNPITAIAIVTGLAFSAGAMAETMSQRDYAAGIERIESEYKSDKKNCESLSGNANDICMAEAVSKEKVAKANLDATNKNTRQARNDARNVKAEADYSVAMEKCDDKTGNKKDVCVKEAKAAEIAAKADSKAKLKTSKAKNVANEKSAEAYKEANEESADAKHDAAVVKHDAEYSVAREKCDALAGNAKTNCLNEAKARYGKM